MHTHKHFHGKKAHEHEHNHISKKWADILDEDKTSILYRNDDLTPLHGPHKHEKIYENK